ncbi:MAG: DinB family protein [Phycisphaerales bacterium]|jgi:hypothetical protein|nr:DinB family protein [Phycisphaerales bacterium]
MSRAAALARSVRVSCPLFTRFLAGFDASNGTRQAPGLPNHCVWTLGHCALTLHRASDRVAGHDDPRPLPASDFVAVQPRPPGAFYTESVAFASTPRDDPSMYPSVERAREIFEFACERLASEVERASEAQLDRPTAWGPTPVPVADLITRMIVHNGAHAGQLTDLRRALGMTRVVG